MVGVGDSSSSPMMTVEKEDDEHLPRDDYLFRLRNGDLDLNVRNQSLRWIRKACYRHSFGNVCLYSAMRLFDRFISFFFESRDKIKRKKWMFQLSAVASLSLAAKLEEVQVPYLVDLQMGGSEFVFEAKTIRRMETMVMSTLKWRIKASTPYDYVHYFLKNVNCDDDPSDIALDRSVEIISHTIEDIEFLEFRPSEIAAAVAIYVAGELQQCDKEKALSSITEVDKGRVDRCVVLIGNISSTPTPPLHIDRAAPPESPNGVLETTSFSHESDESGAGSWPGSPDPESKRIRLE